VGLVDDITRERVEPSSVAVWWLGQAGYAYKLGGTVVYIDPYLSGMTNPSRLVEPAVMPWEIDNADIVLSTHDHEDHADNGTLPIVAMSSPKALFIGPGSSCSKMLEWGMPRNRVMAMARGGERRLEDLTIFATKAVHTDDSVGYVVEGNGVSLYHSGDTLFFMEMREIGERFSLDIAFIPINGKWGNFGVQEAVVAAKLLHPRLLVPMHYGMFRENTVDPQTFLDMAKKEIPGQRISLIDYRGKLVYKRQ